MLYNAITVGISSERESNSEQGRARQSKAEQGRARQSKAEQGRARQSKAEHALYLVSKIATIFALVILISFGVVSASRVLVSQQASTKLLFFSGRQKSFDRPIVQLAQEFPRVSYFRQDSSFGKAVGRLEFKGSDAPSLYMLQGHGESSDVSSKGFSLVTDFSVMNSKIASVGGSSIDMANNRFLVAGFTGLLLSLLFSDADF